MGKWVLLPLLLLVASGPTLVYILVVELTQYNTVRQPSWYQTKPNQHIYIHACIHTYTHIHTKLWNFAPVSVRSCAKTPNGCSWLFWFERFPHFTFLVCALVCWKPENGLILEGEEEENSCNSRSEATTNGFSSSLLLAGVAPEATISRSFILFWMSKVRRREMRDARCEMTSKSALLLLLLLVGIVQQLLWCLHFFPQPLKEALEPSSGAFSPPYYHSCLLKRDNRERKKERESERAKERKRERPLLNQLMRGPSKWLIGFRLATSGSYKFISCRQRWLWKRSTF